MEVQLSKGQLLALAREAAEDASLASTDCLTRMGLVRLRAALDEVEASSEFLLRVAHQSLLKPPID